MSAGVNGSFKCACMILINPGDEVMVFELYYGDHLSTLSGIGDCAAVDFSSRAGVRVAPFMRVKKV